MWGDDKYKSRVKLTTSLLMLKPNSSQSSIDLQGTQKTQIKSRRHPEGNGISKLSWHSGSSRSSTVWSCFCSHLVYQMSLYCQSGEKHPWWRPVLTSQTRTISWFPDAHPNHLVAAAWRQEPHLLKGIEGYCKMIWKTTHCSHSWSMEKSLSHIGAHKINLIHF